MDLIASHWQSYECLDAGNTEKLERWGDYWLRREDLNATWSTNTNNPAWKNVDMQFDVTSKRWQQLQDCPSAWTINYRDLSFKISPTSYKHTGLFPEQAANWDFIHEMISQAQRPINVLNLFAYTGGATLASASANANKVVHVDAVKACIQWAKENATLSQLGSAPIHYIVEDAMTFVKREIKRGHKYQAIIMDPPHYGIGPKNQRWKLSQHLQPLVEACGQLLEQPLFFLISTYSVDSNQAQLQHLMQRYIQPKFKRGYCQTGQLLLPITQQKENLPCGIYGRCYER